MSGPKVIRVVTREELVARCNSQLARLDAALDQWIRSGRRHEALDEAEIAEAKRRRDTVRQLIDRGEFSEAQNAAREEIEFLKTDREQRIANAINSAARLRLSRRRAAASVLAALAESRNEMPEALRARLENIASGKLDETAAITQGIALLSDSETAGRLTQRQLELAESLKESGGRESYNEWLATQPVAGEDPTLSKLEQQLAEIQQLVPTEDVDPLGAELKKLCVEPESPRRAMKVDSLAITVAQVLAAAREKDSLRASLELIAAELGQLTSPATQQLREEFASITDRTPAGVLRELLRRSEATLQKAQADFAAAAGRKALLVGLAGLGYKVTEGMTTAWVRDGRIVMRNMSQPRYGVELLGDAESGRLQARAVAFSEAGIRDSAREKDVETSWCETLSTLGGQLAGAGGGITIEKALAAGQVPLKLVTSQLESSSEDEASRGPAKRER